MPPKMNSKAKAANERKAGAAAEKDAAAARAAEAREAEEWSKGAKGKAPKEDKAAKAAEAAARKAEAARLLAEEEASIKTVKAAPKAGAKKAAPKPSVPSFDDGIAPDKGKGRALVEEYSASGIDDALDALSLATAKTDKASVGARAAIAVDAHPERRYKAAFEAYKEARLPELKKERPGLRLQQMNNEMYDEFKKHPSNPFNQVTVAYDATKAEKVAALQADQELKAARG